MKWILTLHPLFGLYPVKCKELCCHLLDRKCDSRWSRKYIKCVAVVTGELQISLQIFYSLWVEYSGQGGY